MFHVKQSVSVYALWCVQPTNGVALVSVYTSKVLALVVCKPFECVSIQLTSNKRAKVKARPCVQTKWHY